MQAPEALRSRPRRRPSSSNPVTWGDGVLEYCANWELHPASAGLGMLSERNR